MKTHSLAGLHFSSSLAKFPHFFVPPCCGRLGFLEAFPRQSCPRRPVWKVGRRFPFGAGIFCRGRSFFGPFCSPFFARWLFRAPVCSPLNRHPLSYLPDFFPPFSLWAFPVKEDRFIVALFFSDPPQPSPQSLLVPIRACHPPTDAFWRWARLQRVRPYFH